MIIVERIDDIDAIEDIEPAWTNLLAQSETDVIFLTPRWLRTWWRVFGGDRELYILVVRSGDEVIGIAPLMRTTTGRRRRANRVIEFIGTPNADYFDIVGIDKRVVLEHVLRYLHDRPEEWTRIDLTQFPERSCTLPALRDIQRGGGHPIWIREIESCFGLVYDGPESERARFAFKKSKSLRNTLNVLNKGGGLYFERVQDPEACRRYLPLLFQLHINRWNGTPTPSKFLSERHRRFHYELLESLMPVGQIYFAHVRHGAAPLAFALCFEYKNTVSYYTLALNQYYWKRSPGQIIFALLGETCLRQGYDLDYSRGAQEYKNAFANRSSVNYRVTIYSRASEHRRDRAIARLKAAGPVTRLLHNERVQAVKARAVWAIREGGIGRLLATIAGKAVGIFRRHIVDFRPYLIFRFDGVPDLSIRPKIPIKVRRFGPADIGRILTFYGAPEESPQYRMVAARLEKKADCIAGLHEGNIVAICWGLHHDGGRREPDQALVPGANEIAICDILESPIYRGTGVVPFLLSRQLNNYRGRGLVVLAGVARSDKPARRTFQQLNFKRAGSLWVLRLFGVRIN